MNETIKPEIKHRGSRSQQPPWLDGEEHQQLITLHPSFLPKPA